MTLPDRGHKGVGHGHGIHFRIDGDHLKVRERLGDCAVSKIGARARCAEKFWDVRKLTLRRERNGSEGGRVQRRVGVAPAGFAPVGKCMFQHPVGDRGGGLQRFAPLDMAANTVVYSIETATVTERVAMTERTTIKAEPAEVTFGEVFIDRS